MQNPALASEPVTQHAKARHHKASASSPLTSIATSIALLQVDSCSTAIKPGQPSASTARDSYTLISLPARPPAPRLGESSRHRQVSRCAKPQPAEISQEPELGSGVSAPLLAAGCRHAGSGGWPEAAVRFPGLPAVHLAPAGRLMTSCVLRRPSGTSVPANKTACLEAHASCCGAPCSPRAQARSTQTSVPS